MRASAPVARRLGRPMTDRCLFILVCLMLLVGCTPPGLSSGPSQGPGGPDGGPSGGPDGGPGGGPQGGGPQGAAPTGGGDVGLPSLSWTPGEIMDIPVVAMDYVSQTIETSAAGFEGDVGSRIGSMYQALEGSKVDKTGPAFVVLTDPWGPTMRAAVAFPVAAGTTAEVVPEGFALEQLPAGDALAMVYQGARGGLPEADVTLLAKAGRSAAEGNTRIYVLLDRPEQAGPAGPKTKVMLRL